MIDQFITKKEFIAFNTSDKKEIKVRKGIVLTRVSRLIDGSIYRLKEKGVIKIIEFTNACLLMNCQRYNKVSSDQNISIKNYYVSFWYLLNNQPGRIGVLEDISFVEIDKSNIMAFKMKMEEMVKSQYPDVLDVTVISWQKLRR